MKNKKLLMLVLASLSVTAGSAFLATGCTPEEPNTPVTPGHEHSYTWQSNAEGHWEECTCGDKKAEPVDHVDVKNNETDAAGKDGKCDVCDYEIKQVVTFNMQDHGTAPDAKEVSFGAKVPKPADPEEDGWTFGGWYKDAGCDTAFDFDVDVITDNTVIYAKWTPDTTPGAGPSTAYELELGTPNPHTFTSKGYSYYKYTAAANGRYQVDLPNGISGKCHFTTSLDENGETYGNGCDSDVKYFDLAEGETVYVKLSCAETLSDDAEVSVTVSTVTNEPLPADSWLAGFYSNGAGTSFTIDRKGDGSITYGLYTGGFNYVGGIYNDVVSFTHSYTSPMAGTDSYTIKHTDKDTYYLTGKSTLGRINPITFIYYPESDVHYEKAFFSGIYKPVEGAEVKVTEFGLKDNGGYFIQNGIKTPVANSSVDATYNFLKFGQYYLTANVENGEVVSVSVFSNGMSAPVIYNRVADMAPDTLPLEEDDEYLGTSYSIISSSGIQKFVVGETQSSFTITAYDKKAQHYVIEVSGTTYNLVFEGEGNNKTIALLDADDKPLDTLKFYFVDYKDLPTTAAASTTLSVADFKKDFYHFKVTETGWYTFDNTNADFSIYYNLNEDYPTMTIYGKYIDCSDGAKTVYLAEGTVVGIQNMSGEHTGNLTLTLGKGVTPKGLNETDPYVLEDAGVATVSYLPKGQKFYVKLNKSGKFMVKVTYGEYGSRDLSYTVNGVSVGYDSETAEWNGITYFNPNYKFTSDGSVIIVVNGNDYETVTVSVISDYTDGATTLEFTDSVADDVLTKSATVSQDGTYYVADTHGADLVVTASSAFTAKVNGVDADVYEDEDEGTYTLIVYADKELYVSLSSVTSATFTLSYDKGSEAFPIEIDVSSGPFKYTLEGDITMYFKFTEAGSFVVSGSEYMNYCLNDEYSAIERDEELVVEVGDVLIVTNPDFGYEYNFTVGRMLPPEIRGNYTYTDGDSEVSVKISLSSVTVGSKEYGLVSVSGDTYQLKAKDDSTLALTISGDTLTLGSNTLTLVPVFTASQVGTYSNENVTLTINADGSGELTIMGSTDPIKVEEYDGEYEFQDYFYTTFTFTFNEDGNILITCMSYGLSDTVLTKA